jgi:hypothetical protein
MVLLVLVLVLLLKIAVVVADDSLLRDSLALYSLLVHTDGDQHVTPSRAHVRRRQLFFQALDFPPTQLSLALAWPRPEAQRRTRTRAAMSNGQGLKASCVHGSDRSDRRACLCMILIL